MSTRAWADKNALTFGIIHSLKSYLKSLSTIPLLRFMRPAFRRKVRVQSSFLWFLVQLMFFLFQRLFLQNWFNICFCPLWVEKSATCRWATWLTIRRATRGALGTRPTHGLRHWKLRRGSWCRGVCGLDGELIIPLLCWWLVDLRAWNDCCYRLRWCSRHGCRHRLIKRLATGS